ncbi:tripartite motif-containing protein 3-like, partial [Saccostrea cucullata]|uniref:tripartite motif-containing protein 3-like n=1 Tax=Saccostrea cuccullata TaxID=36930 RepID=UPI002ED26CB0
KSTRFRSISETNPVFTVETEIDKVKDAGDLTPPPEIDTNHLHPSLNSDQCESDSGYESFSSRKVSTCSLYPAGVPRADSRQSSNKLLGGRRISFTSENLSELLPGSPDFLRAGSPNNHRKKSTRRCPTDVCYSPALCENFKRGFRHSFQRERSYSSCSGTGGTDGVNISLHNIIGKRGTGKGQFRNATSLSHFSSGSIIVTDIINCRVTLFHMSGRVVHEINTGPGSEPWATAVLPNGNLVVSLQKPGSLAIFDAKGEYIKDIAGHLLVKPSGVATDRKGRIVVSDVNTDSVYILDQDGEVLKGLGQEPDVPITFEEPRYVEVTCKDKILVCDSGKHCVNVFDSDGNFLHKFGSYGQDSGQFRFPYGITSDFEENIYVADYYNNRVSMFSISGEFLCHILTPCMKLKRPQGLDMWDGMAESVLFVTHGEMKAQEVVAFKIIMGSKNRFKKSMEVYI